MARWEMEDWKDALFVGVIAVPMALSALCGVVVLGDQGLRWLKSGTWTERTIRDVIGHPIFTETTGWLGTDRILQMDTVPLWQWNLLIFPSVWVLTVILVHLSFRY
jgi:hypothetical protein